MNHPTENDKTEDAAFAERYLGAFGAEVDTDAGWRRIRHVVNTTVPPSPTLVQRLRAWFELNPRRTLRPLAITAVLAAGATTLFVTGTAQSMVKIFEPEQVAAVSVNLQNLGSLPDLNDYGAMQTTRKLQVHRAADLGAAATATGLHVLTPGAFPRSVTGDPTFLSVSPGTASFTFSAAKAQAAATRDGKALPALPSGIDGSTLFLEAGPAVIETVGSITPPAGLSGAPAAPRVRLDGPGLETAEAPGISLLNGIPQLVIVQMKAPVVSSTGVSVKQLEDALLSLPGIPAGLADQIKLIGNPATTLPIPIPANLATSKQATVGGVRAVLVGDSTGIGSAVVWSKDGMVYAVAGTLTDNEVMAIANSLH